MESLQSPPRAVLTLRSFKAAAMARSEAAPLASYALESLGAVEFNTVSPRRRDTAEVPS